MKGLRNVQSLGLSGTKVTDAGLKHLQGLKKLKELLLFGTDVTDEGIKKLHRALPKCEIRR